MKKSDRPVASRRRFLTTTGGLMGILAARIPPAQGQQRQISYLCWNNFAPASDKKLAEIGRRFTKDTGIGLRIDHIAAAQQAASTPPRCRRRPATTSSRCACTSRGSTSPSSWMCPMW